MNDGPACRIQIQIFVLAAHCVVHIYTQGQLALDGISEKYTSIYPTWGILVLNLRPVQIAVLRIHVCLRN